VTQQSEVTDPKVLTQVNSTSYTPRPTEKLLTVVPCHWLGPPSFRFRKKINAGLKSVTQYFTLVGTQKHSPLNILNF